MNVKMPEPVAWRWKWKDLPDAGWQCSMVGGWRDTSAIMTQSLITIDQAEAYADARVKKALEKVESTVRSNADACYSFVVKAMLHTNADAIRTLISKEQE